MKLRKILYFVLFTFFAVQLQAQNENFNLTFSQPIKAKRTAGISTSGRVGNKLYITKADWLRGECSILIYDKKLNLEKEVIFKQRNCKNLPHCIGKEFKYERTLFFKDKILLFFDTFEKSSKNRMLFCQQMDLDGNFVGELTELDNIQAQKKSNSGNFRIEACEDSSKFVVIQNLPYEKKADEAFGFKVYDGNLKNLSNSQITLPYKDKDASIINYYLTNKGDIYMLLNVQLEKKKKEKGQDDEFYSLLCLNSSTDNSLAEFKLKLPKRNIVDINLQVDNKNNLVACAGFFSDIKSSALWSVDIDGFFYLNVDVKSKKIVSESYKNLSDELVNELNGKKADKKIKESKGVNNHFEIRNIVQRPDGSSLIVAEYRDYYMIENCTTNANGGQTCTRTHHYIRNSIFIIAISPKGEVLSFFDIPKKQHTVNDNGMFSSFMMMQKGDRTFFIYNDNKNNMDPDKKTVRDVNTYRAVKSGILVAVEILPDGRYKKEQLLLSKEFKMVPRPEAGFEVDKGVNILPIFTYPKTKKLAFIRFELK